jgi:hypothetical protein
MSERLPATSVSDGFVLTGIEVVVSEPQRFHKTAHGLRSRAFLNKLNHGASFNWASRGWSQLRELFVN